MTQSSAWWSTEGTTIFLKIFCYPCYRQEVTGSLLLPASCDRLHFLTNFSRAAHPVLIQSVARSTNTLESSRGVSAFSTRTDIGNSDTLINIYDIKQGVQFFLFFRAHHDNTQTEQISKMISNPYLRTPV